MSQPRIEMNATMLPNGKILTVGGSLNDEDTTTASLQADLYDPATNTMAFRWLECFRPALSLRFFTAAGRHGMGRRR